MKKFLIALFLSLFAATSIFAQSTDFNQLFNERQNTAVVVDYFIQHEEDRESITTYGIVLDNEGLIMFSPTGSSWYSRNDQFKNFKIIMPGEDASGVDGQFLGEDPITGWLFIRADKSICNKLTPITTFPRTRPETGELLWSVSLRSKDFAFKPFFMSARFSASYLVPFEYGATDKELGVSNVPVFNENGDFVGWTDGFYVDHYIMEVQPDGYYNIVLESKHYTRKFLLAEPFFSHINIAFENLKNQNISWLGVTGFKPVNHDVKEFYKIEDQGALIISDVIKDGPADKAGILSKDIIIAINGLPLANLNPNDVQPHDFKFNISMMQPGQTIKLTVLRDGQPQELTVQLTQAPKRLKDANWNYFSKLGLSIRDTLTDDNVYFRTLEVEPQPGVIVKYIKPNSLADNASMKFGDWIKEIDNKPVKDLTEASDILTKVLEDKKKKEIIVLVDRNGQTKVLNIDIK